MNIAVIFAGGRGQRLNNNDNALPKQFLEINGKPILIHTLLLFENHCEIDKIYLVILPEFKDYTKKLLAKYNITKVVQVVDGGASAQESIYNGLLAANIDNPKDSVVLIHDGVRPIVTQEVISANIKQVLKNGNAITSTPCYETILVSGDGISPREVPIRKETFAAQAPQSFRLGEILEAHNKIRQSKNCYENIVDSCTLYNQLGKKTFLVRGNFGNIKVTTPQDVYILKGILDYKEQEKLAEGIK